MIDEVVVSYQSIQVENERFKKSVSKLNIEKEETIDVVKKQYEKQKQKDLEALREYIVQVNYLWRLPYLALRDQSRMSNIFQI
jgi:hypothetical protein